MNWSRADLRSFPRPALERLARFLRVATPEALPIGLLVHEVYRRIRRAR